MRPLPWSTLKLQCRPDTGERIQQRFFADRRGQIGALGAAAQIHREHVMTLRGNRHRLFKIQRIAAAKTQENIPVFG